MPDRIIRERALTSRTLNDLSDAAERMFWRLTVVADDYGCFDADPRVLLAKCYPLRVGGLTPSKIEKVRDELQAVGLVGLYQVDGRCYGVLVNWDKHQRRDRRGKPKFPLPPGYPAVPGDSQESAAAPGNSRPRVESRESRGGIGGPTDPPPISGGSYGEPVRAVPKPTSQPKGEAVWVGRRKVKIPSRVKPIVRAWTSAFEAKFGVKPGEPREWDVDSAVRMNDRHGTERVIRILEGAIRVGTLRMRQKERWTIEAVEDDWEVLVAMDAKGELR